MWCREESMFHEKELDSMSNMTALPSLSHKLTSEACSESFTFLDSSALEQRYDYNSVTINRRMQIQIFCFPKETQNLNKEEFNQALSFEYILLTNQPKYNLNET